MLLALRRNKKTYLAACFGFFLGVGFSWLGAPAYRSVVASIYEREFVALTFQCDQAMRGHRIQKLELMQKPSAENVDLLKAAEIALIDCQDYDIMQKQLARLGLTESDIGELVLRAAENSSTGLNTVVDIHEIRY